MDGPRIWAIPECGLKNGTGCSLTDTSIKCVELGRYSKASKYFAAILAKQSKLVSKTVKPVLSGHSKEDQKLVFKTDYRLMQVKSMAEWSILQYFRPSLGYHLSLRFLFCLLLSGRLRQFLL